MAPNKILIAALSDPVLEKGLMDQGFQCDYVPYISYQELLSIIHQYTGIVIASQTRITKEVIDAAHQLKFVARAGSGMENIDVEYAKGKNIICLNSPEGNANSVGEHAAGLLLAFYHNIVTSFLEIRKENWLVEESRVHELEGRTVGIIGYGNTGKAFARKLSGFNLNLLAYDKYLQGFTDEFVTESNMENLFEKSEIVSLHIPLSHETKKMVNYEYLKRFQQPIFLINTSRGNIVDHEQLLQCVKEGRVKGAALDVYENENFDSHTTRDRRIFQELVGTGRVIFTPHIAGKSFESKRKIAEVLLKKIHMLF